MNENSIIKKLENFAIIINNYISDNIDLKEIELGLKEIESYTEEIKHTDLNPLIKAYSEYIYGATIPFYKYSDSQIILINKRVRESGYRSDLIYGQLCVENGMEIENFNEKTINNKI